MTKTSVKEPVIQGVFVVKNDRGLHTRPSTELVKCASTFKSQIFLSYHKITVNAKSLLGVLMLSATKGSRIKIEANGEDAKEAINTLITLAKDKFHIHY